MTLSDDEKLIVLFLFSDEICRAFSTYRHKVQELDSVQRLLPQDQRERIVTEEDNERFSQSLFDAALQSPLKHALHTNVVAFLHAARSPLHLLIIRCNNFGAYLKHVPQFMTFMDPLPLLDDLVSKSVPLRQCLTPLKEKFEQGDLNEKRLRKCILRLIPEVGNAASDHLFMHLFRHGGPACRNFINDAHPGFERYYSWRYAPDIAQIGIFTFVPANLSVEEAIISKDLDLLVDMYSRPIHKALSSATENSCVQSEPNYHLRQYQVNLAQPALEKKNTIICAPTGSGKTIVAGYIIWKHLSTEPNSRVCFLVPNVTLLEQQKKVCEEFLHNSAKISIIHGECNLPFVQTIEASRVVLLTPQMLVNALQSTADERFEKFRLSIFSLMIFDECHHTNDRHPYNAVMDHYHETNYKGDLAANETLPQIVGLTASLGVGGSKNVESAVKHIIKICANLGAEVVSSTVGETAPDLQGIPANTNDEIKMVYDESPTNSLYSLHLFVMNEIEREILSFPEVSSNDALMKVLTFEGEKKKLSSAYLQWISVALKTTIPELHHLSTETRMELNYRFEHLKILFRKMELLVQFDHECAVEYYKREIGRIQVHSALEAKVNEYDASGNEQSAMLTELFQLLKDHFRRGPRTPCRRPRVMIFLKERDYACVMKKLLDENEELSKLGVKADFLISTNRSGDLKLTSQQLREKLRLFEAGEISVLCVTSVAEEGLDIFKCNLIVKYNYASNDIAHVQRRGRARQSISRCVLFTHDEKLKQQEEKNIALEQLALSAVQYINDQPLNWFQYQVKEEIMKANVDRAALRVMETATQRKIEVAQKVYELRCRQCDELMSTSNYVRQQNNSLYFVCDPKIWGRVQSDPISASDQNNESPQVGKITCVKCGLLWGRIVLPYKKIPVPIIKVKSMVLVDSEGTRKSASKWSSVAQSYFLPSVLELADVASMISAAELPQFLTEKLAGLRT